MPQSDLSKIYSVMEILRSGTEYFGKCGIDSPRLTMELMLCHVLEVDRIDLYTNHDRPLVEPELVRLRSFLRRRAKREPLQYILGSSNFMGCRIAVDSSALIPRPETELLADEAIKSLGSGFAGNILDIGTGSGCIAIAIAKTFPNSKITACDISPEALSLAKSNAAANGAANIEFIQCDILRPVQFKAKFEMLVSNPPYIPIGEYNKLEPEITRYEPKQALTDGSEGLSFYERYSLLLPELLESGGTFLFEIGFGQSESIKRIFMEYQLELIRDYSGIERIAKGMRM